MRTKELIIGTLIGAALLGSYLTNGEYLFTMGRSIEVGKGVQTCLQLTYFLPDDIGGDGMYTVTVTTTFTLKQWGVEAKEEPIKYVYSVISNKPSVRECWLTEGPKKLKNRIDNYKVVTSATMAYVDRDGVQLEEEKVFEKETEVKVYGQSPKVTLVQTDKPIYKPGQTVKLRVMTLDEDFIADTDGYVQISIESANGMRMAQWDNVAAPKGLVSLEYELDDDPILGQWKIKVHGDPNTVEQTFKVDEYVLPKFEVTITPPTYLLPTTSKITGKVCAKYTFGQPVKGEMTLKVSYGTMFNSKGRKRPSTQISEQINGCYEFYVDADDVAMANKSYSMYGQLELAATVREEGTGVELSKESIGPSLSSNPIKINMEDDMDGFFKPGFPYKGRVIVTNPDGSPAIGEEIEVSGFYDGQKKYNKIFLTDEAGMVYFALDKLPTNFGELRVTAASTVYNNPRRYYLPPWRFSIYVGDHSKLLKRWYSPSDSYIYIPDTKQQLECDSQLTLNVFYTTKTAEDYTFQAVVTAGDQIVQEKQVKSSMYRDLVDLDLLSIQPDHLLDVFVPPPTVTPEGPTSTTPEIFYEHFVAGEVMDMDADAVRRKRFSPLEESLVQQVKIPLQITETMSPTAKILVYYFTEDGEIVAASTTVKIKNCFRNKASLGFNKDTALPGEDLQMSLRASPDSTCFVGMVDKSVNLLGGDQNMLTPKHVFERVKNYGQRRFYHSNWREDEEYCKEKKQETEGPADGEMDYPMFFDATPEGADASTAFRDIGMWVVTDGQYMSRPCKQRMRHYFVKAAYFTNSNPETGPVARPPDVFRKDNEAGNPVNIRSFFPETWLWDTFVMGSEGETTVTTTIPDTITEWLGNTLCTHPDHGLGVSPIIGVTVFQPFFVSLTMPYSAVRGETLPLKVTVFNYLEKCLTMELTLNENEAFEFVRKDGNKHRFCLCGGDSETTTFYIMPVTIGEIELEATAISLQDNGICQNVILDDQYEGVSDGVQRQLLVEAEGVPQDFTHSSYVCVQDETVDLVQHVIDFPEDLVPQSERASISVVGDIMGPTLSNLKNLLRMPYGCGEQNMASWAPNVYVLQYLQGTNQATQQLEGDAKRYMSSGYQRQMNYRHNDSSYSAFGENMYGNATGSLWLTAFVVKTMGQSAPFVTIRREDITRSVQWLVEKQSEDGCFPQVGKVFSSYMKGGLSDGEENKAGLTSFVLISLLEANLGQEYDEYIQKGFSCLGQFNVEDVDTYTLAVMSYAYTLQTMSQENKLDYRRDDILKELDQRKQAEISGQVYWKREDEPEPAMPTWCWYRAPGAQVEMTAYVLLSKLRDGFSELTEIQAIVQWLTQQRNSYGGFSSTQDTVVAIQALAKFASLTYGGAESELNITAGPLKQKRAFSVTSQNSLVYHTQDFRPKQGDKITASFEGTGCALIQTSLKFNIYKDLDTGPAFHVKVQVHRSSIAKRDCAQRSLSICTSYVKPNGLSNMAIAEVKMLTGWVPVEETLKQLLQSEAIEKYEIDNNYVQLYFDQLSSDRTCVKFDVKQEIRLNPKPGKVRIYDYYETDYTHTVEYGIKTTCGTKAEIAFDNKGQNCTFMQCRADLEEPDFFPTKPAEPAKPAKPKISCPLCPDMVPPKAQLEGIYCNSTVVYKAVVGRSGEYPIKVKSNIREKKKKAVDKFVKPRMSEGCTCQALVPPHEGKAVIFTNGYVLENASEEIVLGDESTVLKLTKTLERKIRRMAAKGKMCTRYERQRRKAARKAQHRPRRA